jgi:UDP-glucose 4-epimerase
VIDNLCNGSIQSLSRVEKITGQKLSYFNIDIRDQTALRKVFKFHPDIYAVIHLAGLKSVSDSINNSSLYYENNLGGAMSLCSVMTEFSCKKLVFSSSAAVYGKSNNHPIKEDYLLSPTSPYGRSKLFIEQMLSDKFTSDNNWSIRILRYFNPIGAHHSGLIGESPTTTPSNLMPLLSQTASGEKDRLLIYGDDYSTPDGSGVRDFIHVMDLATGHVKAIQSMTKPSLLTVNLGTGKGSSVFDLINSFESVSGKKVPFKIVSRRMGDIGSCYAETSLALQEIGWTSHFNLDDMCRDSWRWQVQNPNGYK